MTTDGGPNEPAPAGPSTTPGQPAHRDEEPPRPEEEIADATRQPAAGEVLDDEPAQGEGAPDSW